MGLDLPYFHFRFPVPSREEPVRVPWAARHPRLLAEHHGSLLKRHFRDVPFGPAVHLQVGRIQGQYCACEGISLLELRDLNYERPGGFQTYVFDEHYIKGERTQKESFGEKTVFAQVILIRRVRVYNISISIIFCIFCQFFFYVSNRIFSIKLFWSAFLMFLVDYFFGFFFCCCWILYVSLIIIETANHWHWEY